MPTVGLRYANPDRCSNPVQEEIRFDADGVPIVPEAGGPIAYLIASRDVACLRSVSRRIVDCGEKRASTPLSKYLLKRIEPGQIPLLRVPFSSPRQVGRSIRTLLVNSRRAEYSGVFLLSTKDTIFDHLCADSISRGRTAADSGSARARSGPSFSSSDGFGGWSCGPESSKGDDSPFLGGSQMARDVRRLIRVGAAGTSPVLILGESGTGKELVAREIHRLSGLRGQFVVVNCGAFPESLMESELFGHKKGAFTHAIADKEGLWVLAKDGTLFLDEVGDLTPFQQVKLLRALEDGKIRPVGDTKEIEANARIISATNRDLFSMMAAHEFREDLYFRLAGILIRTPALRDSVDDIPLFARHLWEGIAPEGKALPDEVVEELILGQWPGNVRELRSFLQGLYDIYGAEGPKAEHVRGHMAMWGRSRRRRQEGASDGPGAQIFVGAEPYQPPVSERDFLLHRVECLRHLRRLSQVVRAGKIDGRPLAYGETPNQEEAAGVHCALRSRLAELETLCRQPQFFHGELMFDAAYRLKGHLSYFLSLGAARVVELQRYWNDTLKHDLTSTLGIALREVEELLREA